MVRRVTPSQFKNIVRQAQNKARQVQNKQKQVINKLNQDIRRFNQKAKQAVNKHNQEIRAHNARVRANHQRLKSELARLNRQPTTSQYVTFRTSVKTLHDTYTRLEHHAETQTLGEGYNRVLDLSERETANSLEVMNSLLGTEAEPDQPTDGLIDATLTDELRKISIDLDDRWRGAVFSLNPNNPDAARHFCTSAREVMTQILEIKAPDADVIMLIPDCALTEQGKPTRREKIKFFLHLKGMADDTLEDFVAKDLENIVELFRVFNDGTHGSAGKFDLHQLSTIKKRVEDGIMFLVQLVN